MSITKITQSELQKLKVASLPARPNASGSFGGLGYTSAELRAAFDRLPELLVSRYNALVSAIEGTGEGSLADAVGTGIRGADGTVYSLADVLQHITDGTFATYLKVGESYLDLILAALAPLVSPSFSGVPTAPMPESSDNSGQIATTAWVRALMRPFQQTYDDILSGRRGNVPAGGSAGDVLARSGDGEDALCWQDPAEHLYDALHVKNPTGEGDATRAANLWYVEEKIRAAVDALKGGVGTAYDTLQELAAAITENDSDIAAALSLIASKEVKTTFAVLPANGKVTPAANTEYTAAVPLGSLGLTLAPSPAEGFMAGLEFSTAAADAVTFSFTGASLYATGADCDEGIFSPVSSVHYSAVLWYAGGKYQMAVRRSS